MSRRQKLKNFKRPGERKERKPSRFALPEETKRWILGFLMFLAAIVVGLSFFNRAGLAGQYFMGGFTFLIGKAIFALPLIFVLGGLVFLGSRRMAHQKFREGAVILGIFILILGLSGILSTLTPQLAGQKEGGWLGYLISWPLLRVFGFWVAAIVFSTVIIIGSIILWQLLYHGRKKEVMEKAKIEKFQRPTLIKRIFGPKFKVREIEPTSPSALQSQKPQETKEPFLLELKTSRVEPKISTYKVPPLDLLESDRGTPTTGDIKINSAIIKRTLQNFDIQVEMSEISIGPTVTQYTFKPAEGVKLSRITALNSDLALALASHPIRIEAPIPGRSLVGIEVPNRGRTQVRLRSLFEHPNFQQAISPLTFVLGRDVAGNPLFADLCRMPHLLVAGATGTGKTIALNSIMLSLLYQNSPEILRFILIDPKRVEFPVYNDLPHLLCPVIFDAQKTVNALKWLIGEMERRFDVLSGLKTRDIAAYNEVALRKEIDLMPYIVLIIDELADLMAARGREVEAGIVRLAQMARAVGIHLLVATQRPSVDVITGLIKANITSRITFQVASQVDSRTVLDMAGAEKLLGLGDMLFVSAEIAKPRRIQGAYVSEKEVRKAVNYIKTHLQPQVEGREEKEFSAELSEVLDSSPPTAHTPPLTSQLSERLEEALESKEEFDVFSGEEDPLYEEAKKVVIEARKASASLLQRRLRIGYARAARLIDTLEERGVVGPGEGAKPREIYIGTGEE